MRLISDDRAPATARAALTDDLTRLHRPPDLIDDAALVVTELVSNGVVHGRPDTDDRIEVDWVIDDSSLRISVQDAGGGRTVPRLVPSGPEDLGGRGLGIVDALCRSWSVHLDRGTRVVAVLA